MCTFEWFRWEKIVNRPATLCVSLGPSGRYAALLVPLLKSLEFALMSLAASLMAAACISASLASKFENATTIISPHIARVEST